MVSCETVVETKAGREGRPIRDPVENALGWLYDVLEQRHLGTSPRIAGVSSPVQRAGKFRAQVPRYRSIFSN
jgi:hypothetical protein